MSYEPMRQPRYQVESYEDSEAIIIPARKQWWPLIFLPFWLALWTMGGIAAVWAVFTQFQLFLVFWLVIWAVAWVMAAGSWGWMLAGREIVRVVSGDLEISQVMGPWRRRRLYRGAEVRYLKPSVGRWPFGGGRMYSPFWPGMNNGAVQFEYGARTMSFAGGLDEAEGRMIAERLNNRLPRSAVAN